MTQKTVLPLRAIHTVVIAPDWCADIGKEFDPKRFIAGCKAARVADIEFYTKNAFGHCFFPFRDRPCPRDWVSETRKLARRAGMRFRLYYNAGLDNAMAQARPEWACMNVDGTAVKRYGKTWVWMCLRTGWREKVLDELCQLQEAVHPDAFWLDLLGGPNSYSHGSLDPADACHCNACREAYRERFGHELPKQSDDPRVRRAVYEFSQELRTESIRLILEKLYSLNPGLSLSYNHAGDFWDEMGVRDKSYNARATLNCMEAKPHSAQSFRAKAMWSRGKPFEVMTYGCFQTMFPGTVSGTWIDWNLIPPSYQEVSGAITSAHAGGFRIGVNLPPAGTIRRGEFQNLAPNLSAIERREKWLAGIESVPEIAVVYDPNAELAARASVPERSTLPEVRGLCEALIDANLHSDVVYAGELRPGDYRVIFCGDWLCPAPGMLASLKAFVEGGGLLVATNETSLWTREGERREQFAWADLLGVQYEGLSPYKAANYGVLGGQLKAAAADYPILIMDRALRVASIGAVPLAELLYPEAEVTGETFLWATPFNHPKTPSGKPLITLHRLGKGAVVYIGAPIGKEILNRNDPWLKAVVRAIVRQFASNLAVEADAPPGLFVVLGRTKAARPALVLSLVNRYGGMIVGTRGTKRDHPALGPVRLRLRLSALGRKPRRLQSIDAQGIRWKTTRTHLVVDVGRVGHHAVLRIE